MDLPERIDRIESQRAIADLIHRYGQVVRRDCAEDVADLYVEDGVFEVRRGYPDKPEYTVQSRVEGREEIRASMLPAKGKPHPVPLIHNLTADVEGDRATANCVMEARLSSTGAPHFWGEYNDVCVRVGGRWFFESRCYTIFVDGSSI